MWRRGRALAAEGLPVLLVLASLAGTWAAIVATYRRQAAAPVPLPPIASRPVAVRAPEPPAGPPPAAAVDDGPEPEDEPEPEPPVDPTPAILAPLATEEAEHRRVAAEAGRRADALAAARDRALARAESLRQRERVVKAQVAALDAQGRRLEDEQEALARLRDVLARERDDLKEQLVQLRSRDGFAVLPYKGANGTWRRPIPIECRDGKATIEPGGPSFSLVELATGFGRARPLVAVLARYLEHIDAQPSPDGAPIVPYVLFVVRPDGIRPYYEARSQLEALGITFGYELVEDDVEIEYPDLDDPAEWSETPPLRSRLAGQSGWPLDPTRAGSPSGDAPSSEYIWHRPGNALAMGGAGLQTAPDAAQGADLGGGVNPRLGGAPGQSGFDGEAIGEGARSGPLGSSPGWITAGGAASGRTGPSGAGPGGAGAGGQPGGGDPGRATGLSNASIPQASPWPPVSRSLLGTGSPLESRTIAEPPVHRDGPSYPGRPSPEVGEARAAAMPGPGTSSPPVGAGWDGGADQPGRGPGNPPAAVEGGGRSASAGSGRLAAGGGSRGRAGIGTDLGPVSGGRSAAAVPDVGDSSAGIGAARPGDAAAAAPDGRSSAPGGGPGGASGSGGMAGIPAFRNVPEPVLDLVVVCRPDGVLIHPGGYRLSASKLGEDRVVELLQGVVRNRQAARPDVRWRPRVKFLVEPGGSAIYQEARRQTALAGLGWPVWLEVVEGTLPARLFDPEVLR